MEPTPRIEKLEPRWAPARLVAGPLPAEFGADLTDSNTGDAALSGFEVPNLTFDFSDGWSRRDPVAASNWMSSFKFVQEIAQSTRGDLYVEHFAMLASDGTYADDGTGNVITRATAAGLTAEQVQTLLERAEASESLRAGLLMSRTDRSSG